MKCIKFIVFVFCLACLSSCDTSSNVSPVFKSTFIQYYGDEGDQFAADLLVNDDASMILLGNNVSVGGERTVFLMKIDPFGEVLWELPIGGSNEAGVDVELIKNGPYKGNLVVATNIGNEANSRIRLVRVRQSGEKIDDVVVPLHKNGGFSQVVKGVTSLEKSEGYIITGSADTRLIKESYPITDINDKSDILVFLLSEDFSQLDTVVSKGGEQNGSGVKVFELPSSSESNFALFSYSDRPYFSNDFKFNFSIDRIEDGTPIGNPIGTESNHERLASVVKVPVSQGSGFLMAGTSTTSVENVYGEVYLVKYDDGLQTKLFEKRLQLNRNLKCTSASSSVSGGFYIVANELKTEGVLDIVLLKVSESGELEWTRTFGTREGDDASAAVSALPDGRVVLLNTMDLQTRKKLALVVLNGDGNF